MMPTRIARLAIVGLFLGALSVFPARAQPSELDALAAQVRKALLDANKKSVVIADFTGPTGNISELGREVADQLSACLVKADPQIVVLDRGRLRILLREKKLFTIDLTHEEVAGAVGKLVGAEEVITGKIESDSGAYKVSLTGWIEREKKPFKASASLAKSDKWRSLETRPVDGPDGTTYSFVKKVVSMPECLRCPDPSYTPEARSKRLEGRVLLAVTVTTEGHATDFLLLKRLGLGLDEKAIETIKNWSFRPGSGSDGKPVPVRITVEMEFRLLR